MTHGSPRRAGLLVPLFSCPSTASWGIGDIGDVAPMTAWLARAGLRVLQLLPLNEMAAGQSSPYSAVSAMAIDPIYVRVPDVPDFMACGGEASLNDADRAALNEARRSTRIDYQNVRRVKESALKAAFEQFHIAEWQRDSARARALRAFVAAQAWWIDDYALFRALHASEGGRAWTSWSEPLQRRDPAALGAAQRNMSRGILFFQYLQWVAGTQWQQARRAATANGVGLFGDLPFGVDSHSADVWAHQDEFRLDASVGSPPDDFSAEGQDWGIPVYSDIAVRGRFRWLRDRARRSTDLYDGYRIDHLVGFYRTYCRPHGGAAPYFTPPDAHQQRERGEQILAIFREAGSEIIAEDLGTIPDFVRTSLARLEIPGFRVLRWERFWKEESQGFRDPSNYPAVSVATSGTHDTEPLAVWWANARDDERRKVGEVPSIRHLTHSRQLVSAPYDETVRDVLLEALFASGSNLVLIPLPDVFGWRERINEPATVAPRNWTFRLPWPCDHLDEEPEARARRETLRSWTERYGRFGVDLPAVRTDII